MKYARPPFPIPLFSKFCRLAAKLGYSVRGQRWKLLDLLLDYATKNSDLFRPIETVDLGNGCSAYYPKNSFQIEIVLQSQLHCPRMKTNDCRCFSKVPDTFEDDPSFKFHIRPPEILAMERGFREAGDKLTADVIRAKFPNVFRRRP